MKRAGPNHAGGRKMAETVDIRTGAATGRRGIRERSPGPQEGYWQNLQGCTFVLHLSNFR